MILSCHFGAPQCWPAAKSFTKSLGVLKVENSPFHRRARARKILWQHKWLVYITAAPQSDVYFVRHPPPKLRAAPPPAYHSGAEEMHDVHYIPSVYNEPRYIHLGVCIFACRYVLCTREAAARRHKVSRAN